MVSIPGCQTWNGCKLLTPDELDDPETLRSLVAAIGLRLAYRIIGASQLARVTGDRFGGRPRTTFYWHQRKLKAWRAGDLHNPNSTIMVAQSRSGC